MGSCQSLLSTVDRKYYPYIRPSSTSGPFRHCHLATNLPFPFPCSPTRVSFPRSGPSPPSHGRAVFLLVGLSAHPSTIHALLDALQAKGVGYVAVGSGMPKHALSARAVKQAWDIMRRWCAERGLKHVAVVIAADMKMKVKAARAITGRPVFAAGDVGNEGDEVLLGADMKGRGGITLSALFDVLSCLDLTCNQAATTSTMLYTDIKKDSDSSSEQDLKTTYTTLPGPYQAVPTLDTIFASPLPAPARRDTRPLPAGASLMTLHGDSSCPRDDGWFDGMFALIRAIRQSEDEHVEEVFSVERQRDLGFKAIQREGEITGLCVEYV